jgi:Phospholipase_D-nuclease N-terminal
MLLLGALFALLAIGVWLYCVVDILVTPGAGCRYLPKAAWLAIVTLAFGVGAIAWLLLGRPLSMPQRRAWRADRAWQAERAGGARQDRAFRRAERARARHPAGRARTVGPDDDPEFLSQLDRMIRGRYDTGNDG